MLEGRLVSQGLEKTREAHRGGRRWAAPQEWTRVASEEDRGRIRTKERRLSCPARVQSPGACPCACSRSDAPVHALGRVPLCMLYIRRFEGEQRLSG